MHSSEGRVRDETRLFRVSNKIRLFLFFFFFTYPFADMPCAIPHSRRSYGYHLYTCIGHLPTAIDLFRPKRNHFTANWRINPLPKYDHKEKLNVVVKVFIIANRASAMFYHTIRVHSRFHLLPSM